VSPVPVPSGRLLVARGARVPRATLITGIPRGTALLPPLIAPRIASLSRLALRRLALSRLAAPRWLLSVLWPSPVRRIS